MNLELQKLLLEIFRALPPFIGRVAHDLLKIPVKRGQGVKTAFMRDIGYRNVCFFQILAGRPHTRTRLIYSRGLIFIYAEKILRKCVSLIWLQSASSPILSGSI